MTAIKERIGVRYGRLVVIGKAEKHENGSIQWLCKCDCGNERVIIGARLGRSVHSCGCLGKESRIVINTTHGETRWDNTGKRVLSKEVLTWYKMIYRCHKPKDTSYHKYGAKGIVVCDRWRESFDNFLADMGRAPSPKHSIDRIELN